MAKPDNLEGSHYSNSGGHWLRGIVNKGMRQADRAFGFCVKPYHCQEIPSQGMWATSLRQPIPRRSGKR